ncbi:hypothetical protein VHUM_02892 [Vanrija humicola]|uniref:CCR4-Not complex component Not N-terminal domain-containing protein n=1 Tax=Vanrija humicola TaxID=5417 RepID=A0A7D8Z2H6_VANHU|nr:hypothetical protein VHUM_02892 [Vanrija humicola]
MALRKLQTEIDRTLKAVAQGVETFEATFDKLNHASNSTQKDKLETDLKTQIKKLQRMRDQIKVWLGSSDIKDKSALLDNRKLIETQMERFKALEKEMKMKAFSKEGLIAAARLDPAEKAKRDMVDWIGNTIDELSRQIEQTEAEAEQLQVTGKKKKAAGDRLSELEQLNERRQWHIGRLEIVQRVFENGQINVDQVESIQEDVKYFVEANTEEDFDFDLGIYDELNLQEAEDEYGAADYGHNAEDSSNIDSASVADDSSKTPSKEERKLSKASSAPPTDDTPPSPVQSKRGSSKTAKAAAEAQASAAANAPPPQTTSAPTPTKPAPLPPIRYAAAAAAAVGGATAAAPAASTQAESVTSSYLSKESPHDDEHGYEGEEEETQEAAVPEQSASQSNVSCNKQQSAGAVLMCRVTLPHHPLALASRHHLLRTRPHPQTVLSSSSLSPTLTPSRRVLLQPATTLALARSRASSRTSCRALASPRTWVSWDTP